MSFLLSLNFFLQQSQRRRGQNRFCLEVEGWGVEGSWGKVAQTMCTYVSICKNDKIKEKRK
jgi:hypothetical protein